MTAINTHTKELIIAALKQLMNTNSFSSISVNKIASTCGISRNTFYYHFEDIPSAIRWMLQHELPLTTPRSDELSIEEHFYQQLYAICCYVRENRSVFLCMANSSLEMEFRSMFLKDLSSLFTELVTRFQSSNGCSDEYVHDFTQFLTLTLIQLLENWGYGQIEKSPEEILEFAKSITRIFLGGGHMAV